MAKYPLEALRELRQKRAEEQAQQVLKAAAQTARTLASEARARALREAAEAQFMAEKAGLQKELLAGAYTAGDLELAANFQREAARKLGEFKQTEAQASQARKADQAKEAAQRQRLAQAESDRKLTDQHRQRFHAAVEQQKEAELEEIAADIANSLQARKQK